MSNLDQPVPRQPPELLAPMGSMDMLLAAIHNGADAVYVGMPGFNARARSEDFSFDALKEAIERARLHGVKVLVAFNILIFQEELDEILPDLESLLATHPDAIIVQDVGLARLIKALAPHQAIHASTQMSITCARSMELLQDLDLKRVVLGREVSMDEMRLIRPQTKTELEVFVHGALCVAYSGQCLTSESFGGRSANRGQCAQSCRMPYDLIVDGVKKDMGDQRYLVSPQDLCGLEHIEELCQIGIDSFKIEGRYKSAEYVASACKAYRKAIEGHSATLPQDKANLEVAFSRGFFEGWLGGVHHKNLVPAYHSSHQGLAIGQILRARELGGIPWVSIQTEHELHAGDSLFFTTPEGKGLTGGKVFEVSSDTVNGVKQVGMSRDFNASMLMTGAVVRLNRSPKMDKELQASWKDKQHFKKIPIDLDIEFKIGQAFSLTVSDPSGHRLTVFSSLAVEPAQKKAMDEEQLKKILDSWGGSCFKPNAWTFDIEENGFLPMGEIKSLRQQAQQQLSESRTFQPNKNLDHASFHALLQLKPSQTELAKTPKLSVLIRTPEQLDALSPEKVQTVILEFKHGVGYTKTMNKARSMGFKVSIATTRILKEGQERRLQDLLKIRPDEILVRNHGALHFLREHQAQLDIPWIGDFSLNITNHLSANYFLSKGLTRFTPSYDLNLAQLEKLLLKSDPSCAEVTIHHYMPTFHMEHCVFASFLSSGTTAKDCGLVCRKHQVELMDEKGVRHPLQADQECRNTMFHGVAQSMASLIPHLQTMGIFAYRIEALDESTEVLAQKVQGYAKAIANPAEAEKLKRDLGLTEKYGITEGQLLNQGLYQDRKKVLDSFPPT